jgi:hypothetical protein
MPTSFQESNVAWVFQDDCNVVQYDESSWYRRHFNGCADSAAVDFVAVHGETVWLIEIKDFTTSPPDRQKGPLWQIVTAKVRDTLAGVVAGAANAGNADEQVLFREATARTQLRVVFHCERPTNPRQLFSGMPDAADLQDKLRQALRAVDAHVRVVDCGRPLLGAPWTTTWAPP